jgi:tetratricopeptide (TPR) repeat protein
MASTSHISRAPLVVRALGSLSTLSSAVMCEGLANLGLVHRTRGDLTRAEEMHRKALEINEKLGRLVGMANDYGNLGSVYAIRGDLKQARDFWTKSRNLFARVGKKRELAQIQSLLDGL